MGSLLITAYLITFVACLLSLSYLYRFLIPIKHENTLPPGPWGLPLLGHLHMLGDLPHRSLQRMANKYGPIMFIKLGVVPTIVVSSPEAAELVLKTHDLVFASRPEIKAIDFAGYGQKNGIVFAPYGTYWRNIRKICTAELFSKMELFKPIRKEEVTNFVESIKKDAELGSTIDVSDRVRSLLQDMTFRMIFGSKTNLPNIKSIILEAVELAGTFNLADYIPYIGLLDPQVKYVGPVIEKEGHEEFEEIAEACDHCP